MAIVRIENARLFEEIARLREISLSLVGGPRRPFLRHDARKVRHESWVRGIERPRTTQHHEGLVDLTLVVQDRAESPICLRGVRIQEPCLVEASHGGCEVIPFVEIPGSPSERLAPGLTAAERPRRFTNESLSARPKEFRRLAVSVHRDLIAWNGAFCGQTFGAPGQDRHGE